MTLLEASRVVIAIPLAGPMIYWRTVAAILEMEKPSESDLMVFQGALVDRARNYLVERMLAHPMAPTHLLFLDQDILVQPETLTRLLRADRPVVSAMYRRRLPPHEPMAFLKKGGRKKLLQPISLKKHGLQAVDIVGAGCLLIRRDVFSKIRPPWFTSEWQREGHLSEDFSFCEKLRKARVPVFVDLSTPVLHLEVMGLGSDPQNKVRFFPLD